MRKLLLFILFLVHSIPLFVYEYQQSPKGSISIPYKKSSQTAYENRNRELDPPPEISFIPNSEGESVVQLTFSYFDIKPMGRRGNSISLQPQISQPYGFNADGVYICFTSWPEIGFDQVYNSYITPDGTLFYTNTSNHFYVAEEISPTLCIDPYTGDAFITWHDGWNINEYSDVYITYDSFHITGAAGFLREPWKLIDNPETGFSYTGHDNDQFNCPVVKIGDSPDQSKRRIHILTQNGTPNSSGNIYRNILYGYADFDDEDLLLESEFDWTFTSFPYMDNLHYNDIAKICTDMAVNKNQVAFIGNFGDSLFCLHSDDCGETFNFTTQEWKYPIYNPFHEDGETYQFYNDDGVTPAEMYFALSEDPKCFNGVFTDNDSKIAWLTAYNLNTQENLDEKYRYSPYLFPVIFSFDFNTNTFDFYDIYIQDQDPGDDQPTIPWDLNEDGVVDQYNEDGSVFIPISIPNWSYPGHPQHETGLALLGSFETSSNNNWITAMWFDSRKNYYEEHGEDGYENWENQPEIALSISDDSGVSWSEIKYINANPEDCIIDPQYNLDDNFYYELEGYTTTSLAPLDSLEIIANEPGNYHAKLHLAFFQDITYRIEMWSNTYPQYNGGYPAYAALDIEFQSSWDGPVSSNDDTIVEKVDLIIGNYPNPFNPETNIEFQLSKDTEVKLIIYNVRGQEVVELINDHLNQGFHSIKWSGLDKNNHEVCSGIYYGKLITDNNSDVSKMVLIK